ncbi:F-box protein SKIP19-like [Bidens hawaiensis]|uniref:F-box protein SKIP19-like n=1 Tax=Bidens hawaiensis TaxID=980011 RepID=UPI00404A04FE
MQSKSNRKRSKIVPQPKPICRRVKQSTRNWLGLPSNLMLNILRRVGGFGILWHVQKVCTAWRELCKDPVMWRVVYMYSILSHEYLELCKQAVDRSQGQLVDLTLCDICDQELLQYVADRSSKLRRLAIGHGINLIESDPLKRFSLLEELSFYSAFVKKEHIEVVGRYCSLLKTLKVNFNRYRSHGKDTEVALAIGKNLPQLTHLELIENKMTNIGLQAILDGCLHLQSLDLRGCKYLNLNGDLGKRCSQ